MDQQTLETYSGTFHHLRRKLWRGQWMWPAAIILFLLSFALWQWFGRQMVQVSNTDAGTANVRLPDNSTVLLNPGATLRYHKHFKESTGREVWLSGAAVFTVPPRSNRSSHETAPFMLHTTGMDLLTADARFHVAAQGTATTVQLISGSSMHVHFKDKELTDMVLRKGETLYYDGSHPPSIR